MCLSLQFEVVHFKIQCRKVNMVCIVVLKKKKKIASVLETLFCLSGGEWLRTSCKADNFCFCKYWRQVFESIDNFFFLIYLKLIALMLILKVWFSWNPMFALCIFIGSLHILDYMQYSLSCHCLLKCRFDPASIELAL